MMISYFIEFHNFQTQISFIEKFTSYREEDINQLDVIKNQNLPVNDQFDDGEMENFGERDIVVDYHSITKFKHFPILFIKSSENWANKVKNDSGIVQIYEDNPVILCIDSVRYQFDIDKIHESFYGLTGKNVKLALMDSGIDQSHPDLKEKVKNILNTSDEEDGDFVGHGTFIASLIAGSGKKSGGMYKGIAPDCILTDIKIVNSDGTSSMSNVLIALDRLLGWREDFLPDIILFGWSSVTIETSSEPLIKKYIKLFHQKNIAFIAPAGNFGPQTGTIGIPGSLESVLTVGSIDQLNKIIPESSRGEPNSNIIKPDIVLPGIEVIGAQSLYGTIGKKLKRDEGYISYTGSSISAAIAAGMMAILKQGLPKIRSTELINILKSRENCYQIPNAPPFLQGSGIPDLKKILKHRRLYYKKPTPFKAIVSNSLWSSGFLTIFLILAYFLI